MSWETQPWGIHPGDILRAQIMMIFDDPCCNEAQRIRLIHETAVKHANARMGMTHNQRKMPRFETENEQEKWMNEWFAAYQRHFDYCPKLKVRS